MGIDPLTHRPRTDLSLLANLQGLLAASSLGNLPPGAWGLDNSFRIHADAAQAARIQILQSLFQALVPNNAPNVDLVHLLGAAMLNQPGRPFPGLLLGGEGQVNSAVPSLSAPQMMKEVPLPPPSSSLPGSSSKNSVGVENNSSFSVSQMSSSGNNPTSASTPSAVSPSPEGFNLDHFQEMINSHDGSSSCSLEPWDALTDTESYDLCWRDILA